MASTISRTKADEDTSVAEAAGNARKEMFREWPNDIGVSVVLRPLSFQHLLLFKSGL